MSPRVIFEDKEILVLDKPAGMIVNRSDTTKGEETLQDWVEKYLKIRSTKHEIRKTTADSGVVARQRRTPPQNDVILASEARPESIPISEFFNRSGIVHRLDKETSGILLVAKTLEAFTNLQAQFKSRKVQKTYVALAHGKIEPQEGEINVSVGRLPWNRKRFGVLSGGRESVTQYKTINNLLASRRSGQFTINNEPLTLLELYPKSGRTHQIRVHLQYIHHPIFSDPLYAGRKTSRNDRKLLPRIFLHASKISFFHPVTNELISFKSPLPADLKRFLETLNS